MSVVDKYKVLVCGRTHTGKTSIIRQYIDHNFIPIHFPTPLPMAESTRFADENGSYELNIWDTAGAEEWQSMNTTVYHMSQVIIFVASLDDKDSLTDLPLKWVPLLSESIDLTNCIKILAINKKDLLKTPEKVQVTPEAIETTRAELDATVFQVSAMNNEKVSDVFDFARVEVRNRFPGESKQPAPVKDEHKKKHRSGKKCCH